MKFGIFLLGEKPPTMSGAEVYQRNLEQARVADELGYDTVWLAEHHFSPYGTIADPLTFAAAVAATTKNCRIGSAVAIPAFHNPIKLAERAAMVDCISNGRLDLGVGRGYQEHEFRRFNIPMDESTERFIEAVGVVENLLNNTTYSWDGKFSKGEDICIYPRPVQERIPIYVAVLRTASTIDWVVEHGYGCMVGNPYIPNPELGASLKLLQESKDRAGKIEQDNDVWALTTAFCDHDRDFARSYPRESVELNLKFLQEYAAPFQRGGEVPYDYQAYSDWYTRLDKQDIATYDTMLDMNVTMIGDPDDLIRKILFMHDGDGWQNFILTVNKGGAMDQEKVLSAMKLIATEVIPVVRAESSTAKSR